jgi:predicted extracellular nuclease
MKKILASRSRGATGLRLSVIAALLASIAAPALAVTVAPAGGQVVISQVYGGGGNSGATYKNDFVELFNRSSAPVDLTNWSVQYGSAAGTTWQVTPLTGVVLQPGQYLLVAEAIGAGGTVALPAPDATGTIAMSATTGKIALSNSKTPLAGASPTGSAVVDLVGFGTANGFEGTVGPTLSNTLAMFRGDDGCTDTDNNAADFTTAAPAPRNTSSELRVCGTPVQRPIVATCPASFALAQGSSGATGLTATDQDGIVNGASITAGAIPGISLVNFTAADAAGGVASVNLNVAAGVALGSYPITVSFTNDQSQSTSCDIAVSVQPLAAVTHTIPQIQGSGAASAFVNTVQTAEGVITAKVSSGFFMQDPAGDGDPTTSDGIFVYTGSAINTVAIGDRVRVTGQIAEYAPTGATRSVTEFQNVTQVVAQSSGNTVTPTNIQLPFANFGQVEGMLVRFTSPLNVAQSEYLGTRGELTLSNGPLEVPTNRYPARSSEAIALAAANAVNSIILDDGSFTTPVTIPYIGQDETIRVGDSVGDLTGVIDFGATGDGSVVYKVQPTVTPVFSRDNPRTGAPVLAAGNVKVASANVLNFFTVFTDGTDAFGHTGQGCSLGSSVAKSNCRGADSMAEFVRQRDKIVNELKAIDADVFGLMEIQNNGETTVSYLVDQLNAAIGQVTYQYVPQPPSTGTDAIRVAMIYKPTRLTPLGVSMSDAATINNRPPFAQTFKALNGEKFSLIVNHMKSKGSCPSGTGADADQGDSQSCWNATRVQQAQELMNVFVPQVIAAAGDPDVLIIGDMNSYGMEDPIAFITSKGYVNQLERYVRPKSIPHSFIFAGTSGYLDHALASAALSPQVADVAEWHNNADEPPVIDYNLDGKPQDLYTPLPYRASDHDPVVISLNLQSGASDVTGNFNAVPGALAFNRATQKFAGTLTVTNRGSVAVSGPLQVQLNGLAAGISLDNASGIHAGAPYITIGSGTSIAPGASVSLPLTFTDPSKATIGFTTTIYSGAF